MAGLNNADADGRVVLDSGARVLKFVLLNAAAHFSKVCLPGQYLVRPLASLLDLPWIS